MNKQEILNKILEQRVLPIFNFDDVNTSLQVMKALYSGGLRVVEFTNRSSNAYETFKHLKDAVQSLPGLQLGIGTIKNEKQAEKFIAAGCDFIVSPNIKKEIAYVANQAGILWIPGCFTPTEISLAEDEQIPLIKLYPANVVGPSYIKAMREVFPNILFMPTGGVEPVEENLKQWFFAGASAVGMSGKLVNKELATSKDFDSLTKKAENLVNILNKMNID